MAAIRGVDPDGVIRTLQARGYIDEVGRDTGPGQAVLYGTTATFLERLGLDTIDDLPPIAEFIPGADVVEALEDGLAGHPDHRGRRSRASTAQVPTALVPASGRPTVAPDPEPEPPLWEQWAEQSAELPQGERLQKVLAATGWGSRRDLRGSDRRGPGHGQR